MLTDQCENGLAFARGKAAFSRSLAGGQTRCHLPWQDFGIVLYGASRFATTMATPEVGADLLAETEGDEVQMCGAVAFDHTKGRYPTAVLALVGDDTTYPNRIILAKNKDHSRIPHG
jgi:hypothetical protein